MQDPKVINRMKELAASNGGLLTPDVVVKEARKKTSPLHSYFDWNDRVAAEKWRRDQARELIRSVRVVLHEETVQVKAIGYVQDPDKSHGDQGYASVADLRSDRDRALRALAAELNRAEAAMSRAYEVAYALGLQDDVDAVLAQIRGMKSAA